MEVDTICSRLRNGSECGIALEREMGIEDEEAKGTEYTTRRRIKYDAGKAMALGGLHFALCTVKGRLRDMGSL